MFFKHLRSNFLNNLSPKYQGVIPQKPRRHRINDASTQTPRWNRLLSVEICPITCRRHYIRSPLWCYHGSSLLADVQDAILVLHPIRAWWNMYVAFTLPQRDQQLQLTTVDEQWRFSGIAIEFTPAAKQIRWYLTLSKTAASYLHQCSLLHLSTWF